MATLLHKMAEQYKHPHGLLGWFAGFTMDHINRQCNEWTLSKLDIRPDDNVLEIGYGPGQAIASVLSIVDAGKVAGIDFSEAMFAKAKRRNASAVASGKVDLRLGNAEHLPFADGTFDKVFSVNVIYFWKDAVHNLREARRVMKDGGRIVIYTGDRDQMANIKITRTGLYQLYSGEECRNLLQAAGFRNVRFEAKAIRQGPISWAVCTSGEK